MPFKSWIVGYDFSSAADAALDFAAREAPQRGIEEIRIVHAFTLSERLSALGEADLSRVRTAVEDRIREVIQPALDRLADVEGLRVRREVVIGPAARVLADVAAEGAALLVIGLEDGALERAIPGQPAQRLLRTARSPVLAIPQSWRPRPLKTSLAAIDLSEHSRAVLRQAAKMFGRDGLSLVSIIDPSPMELLEDVVLQERESVEARQAALESFLHSEVQLGGRIEVLKKSPSGQAILDVAELLDVDALTLGTHGHGALHRAFLGSAAGRVLAHTTRPTLFVPERGRDIDWL